MHKHDITGLSIAVVDDQRVVWAQGFGYADLARGIPATADTLYRLGSISKLFTAAAVMQLVEQGKVDLDHPLAEYLPGFSVKTRFPRAGPITVRTVMTHHAGLPADRLKGMFSRRPADFGDLAKILGDEYVTHPPNFAFGYSNLGFSLLGSMVEKASGQNFSTYLDEALLRPMGMRHSRFTTSAQGEGMSKAYKSGAEVEEFGLRDVPAGGLNSSVADMSRFLSTLFTEGRSGEQQVLRAATVKEMWQPQNGTVALDMGFRVGLAWMLGGLGEMSIPDAGVVAHHAGGTLNFNSQLVVLPERKLGVIVLSNSSGSIRAVSHIAGEAIRAALEAKTGRPTPAPDERVRCDGQASAEMLAAFPGQYATLYGLVTVRADGGDLRAKLGSTEMRLAVCDDGQLRLRYKLWGLIPIDLGELGRIGLARTRVANREILVARSGPQTMVAGERVTSVELPAGLQGYLGEYEVADLGEDVPLLRRVKLEYRDGLLLADVTFAEGTIRHALNPVSDREATVAGLGRYGGESVRFRTEGGVDYISFEGLDLRRTPH